MREASEMPPPLLKLSEPEPTQTSGDSFFKHHRLKTGLLLLSCATLLTGCTHPIKPKLEIRTDFLIPQVDPRIETCPPWPEKPSDTSKQSAAAGLLNDGKEAYDTCNANLNAVVQTLKDAISQLMEIKDELTKTPDSTH